MTVGSELTTILFDLDGTLIDSSDGVVDAVNHALIGVGDSPRHPEEIKPWIGYSLRVMFPHFSDQPYEKLRALFLEKADLEVADSAKELLGASKTLAALHDAGYQLGIVSTKRRLHIEQIVDRFDWRILFQTFVGGDEVTHVKPHGEPFELAMRHLNTKPTSCMIVGDTENDILPARQMGSYAVAVRSIYESRNGGWSDATLRSNPDEKIDHLNELLAIVKRLERKYDTRRAV